MPLSMHQASAPVFVRQLQSIAAVLVKGEAFAVERKIDPAVLLVHRLVPDLHPLPRQIQIGTDAAKGAVARLAQVDIPSFPDTETSFAELQARIATTIAFIESIPASQFDGSEERIVTLNFGAESMPMPGETYLLRLALPNFFFHMTMAYTILRAQGVEIGKRDYLGGR